MGGNYLGSCTVVVEKLSAAYSCGDDTFLCDWEFGLWREAILLSRFGVPVNVHLELAFPLGVEENGAT